MHFDMYLRPSTPDHCEYPRSLSSFLHSLILFRPHAYEHPLTPLRPLSRADPPKLCPEQSLTVPPLFFVCVWCDSRGRLYGGSDNNEEASKWGRWDRLCPRVWGIGTKQSTLSMGCSTSSASPSVPSSSLPFFPLRGDPQTNSDLLDDLPEQDSSDSDEKISTVDDSLSPPPPLALPVSAALWETRVGTPTARMTEETGDVGSRRGDRLRTTTGDEAELADRSRVRTLESGSREEALRGSEPVLGPPVRSGRSIRQQRGAVGFRFPLDETQPTYRAGDRSNDGDEYQPWSDFHSVHPTLSSSPVSMPYPTPLPMMSMHDGFIVHPNLKSESRGACFPSPVASIPRQAPLFSSRRSSPSSSSIGFHFMERDVKQPSSPKHRGCHRSIGDRFAEERKQHFRRSKGARLNPTTTPSAETKRRELRFPSAVSLSVCASDPPSLFSPSRHESGVHSMVPSSSRTIELKQFDVHGNGLHGDPSARDEYEVHYSSLLNQKALHQEAPGSPRLKTIVETDEAMVFGRGRARLEKILGPPRSYASPGPLIPVHAQSSIHPRKSDVVSRRSLNSLTVSHSPVVTNPFHSPILTRERRRDWGDSNTLSSFPST